MLVDRLASHDDPGSADPGKPWAAIVLRNNGELAFTCSPMWHSGLFYTRHEPSGAIAVATDPGELLRLWPHARELDGDYLLDFILLRPDAERTPYSGIHRLTPGDTAVAPVSGHAGLAPLSITTWSGPAVWPPAFRQGPGTTAGYLEVFDAAVERSLPTSGPIVLALSGGLDSTFLAASLIKYNASLISNGGPRPVVGLVHRPVAGSTTVPGADEFPLAAQMAAHYPGQIDVESITNLGGVLGLDAAMAEAHRGWLPVTNPSNSVWLAQLRQRARSLGAVTVFVGATGNYSFSSSHAYAATANRGGHSRARLRLVTQSVQERGVRATLGLISARLQRGRSSGDDGTRAYASLIHVQPEHVGYHARVSSRAAFHESLADRGTSFMGASNPAATGGLLGTDPFEAASVLRFAAEITPREWRKAGPSRGYARLLAKGRVPESIRLNTVRGVQAADAWWVARHHRDRYLSEALAVADTPVLADAIDVDALHAMLSAWPWGYREGPGHLPLLAVDRLLHTAAFVRWVAHQWESWGR